MTALLLAAMTMAVGNGAYDIVLENSEEIMVFPENHVVLIGCLVCQQNCSGGLVCNNSGACCRPVPTLKPDGDLIPEPGTQVTLVVYIMPER